ncbi:uncharacterized protein LOC141623247 [Silene latifolia]|uniref:uncharacterized protein LOC141623247 n=1 Tax=Silene latifolia TaxID=37657 RepID=UPI003D77CC90
MDSGNSGSIQSSSTGGGTSSRGGREDQELESRGGETISALLNPTSLASFDNASSSQLYSLNDGRSFSAYHQQRQVPNYKFDSPTFSQSMMINHSNNNNNNNNSLGMVWPNKHSSIQPSPINTYSSSLDNANNCITSVTNNQQFNTCATQSHQLQRPPLPVSSSMDSTRLAKSSPGSLNQQGSGGGGRSNSNPKKRSRASRRTPTTVLTTDTNNFRQMVQEFTGIPASPFETAFAGRARLDLFGGFGIQLPRVANNGSSMLDVCGSTMQPPHLMRPFPQNNYLKVTTPSILPRPSSVTTVDKFHVSGFQQGDPTTCRRSKTTNSLMNEFALGHNISTTTTTATSATTTCNALGRHQVNSVDEGGGNNNVTSAILAVVDKDAPAPAENHGGVTRGEATVESWICSSD